MRTDGIKGKFVCYSGMALAKSTVEEWKLKKFLIMDGYRSTSLDLSVARVFAVRGETDERDQVLLRIFMENKEGKYYICLDREDYTMYLEEKEVLLQAGLIGEIKGYEEMSDEHGDLTIFNLYISDKMV